MLLNVAYVDTWKVLDQEDLQAYMGLLILAGVYRSNNEATNLMGWGVREAYIPVNYVPATASCHLTSYPIL